MEGNDKIINLTDRMILNARKEINEREEELNSQALRGPDLIKAIELGIEGGEVNLLSLTRVVFRLAESLDKAEHKIETLESVLGLRIKEASLKGTNRKEQEK